MIRATINGKWFTAAPAERKDPCNGCMFMDSPAKTCMDAGQAAIAAGMPDCESRGKQPGFIYVPDPSEGRQQDLLNKDSKLQPQGEQAA